MDGPRFRTTLQDFCAMPWSCSVEKAPAPGISRSITYFGIAATSLFRLLWSLYASPASAPKKCTSAGRLTSNVPPDLRPQIDSPLREIRIVAFRSLVILRRRQHLAVPRVRPLPDQQRHPIARIRTRLSVLPGLQQPLAHLGRALGRSRPLAVRRPIRRLHTDPTQMNVHGNLRGNPVRQVSRVEARAFE